MNVTIFGTGTWAMALARVLSDNGHNLLLVGKDEQQVNELNTSHTNRKYFDASVELPKHVNATLSIEEGVAFSDYLLIAIPSSNFKALLESIRPLLQNKKYIINTTKGFDSVSKQRLSDVVRQTLPRHVVKGIVSLLGPSHAEEVIHRQLTLISATSQRVDHAQDVANLFANTYFRVYVQKD